MASPVIQFRCPEDVYTWLCIQAEEQKLAPPKYVLRLIEETRLGEVARPLVPLADTRFSEVRSVAQVKSKPKEKPQLPPPSRQCVCGSLFHPVTGRCFMCARKRAV